MATGINNVIFSGGVRYKEGSTFLAHLMGKFLREAPWYKYGNLNIDYAVDCFDSSTDIQNFIKIAKEKQFDYLYAVSSYWHLCALEPLYKYWGKKLNYKGQVYTFCSNNMIDYYLTGKKTIVFYFFYAHLIRLAIFFHLFKPLDKFLSSIFSKRKKGYPVSDCS